MQIQKYMIASVAALMLAGCTKDIDIKLGTVAPELVVEGVVNTDTTSQVVYLKKTAYYFSNQPAEVVSGATVTLSDGTSTIALVEDNAKKGAYKTPSGYFGVVGRTYTLHISNIDINSDGVKEEYEASSTIPTKFKIDKIDVTKKKEFGSDVWMVNVWMQDPPVERNFYLVKVSRNDVCVTDSIQEWGTAGDDIFNGFYLEGQQMASLSSDKPDEVLHNGDKVTIEVSDVPEDYMNYINDVITEYWGRNPLFGGQPANIRTNIRQILPQGTAQPAHGYFTAYSTTRKDMIYSE